MGLTGHQVNRAIGITGDIDLVKYVYFIVIYARLLTPMNCGTVALLVTDS